MLIRRDYTANLISHTSFNNHSHGLSTNSATLVIRYYVTLWKKKKKNPSWVGTEIILKLQTFTLANSMEVIYL